MFPIFSNFSISFLLFFFTPPFLFPGFTDETPRDYHCNLGPDGRRRDADERPELCRGTVEFVASKEYMVSALFVLVNKIKIKMIVSRN